MARNWHLPLQVIHANLQIQHGHGMGRLTICRGSMVTGVGSCQSANAAWKRNWAADWRSPRKKPTRRARTGGRASVLTSTF